MLNTYKNLLSEVIKFKSISASSLFTEEINKTADWYISLFQKNNFKTNLIKGFGNPIILASFEASPNLPTCLIYGHYDVQPADKEDGWKSDPFTATEINNRLYGRGTADNKGQSLIHITSILELIKSGDLKYNVKFLIEGNEETGSGQLGQFIKEYSSDLKSNFVMISDGEIAGAQPTIELGFRGVFNAELTVTTSTKDLHSGLFGGATPSSSEVLVNLLSLISSPANKENIFPNIPDIKSEDIAHHSKINFSLDDFIKLSGAKSLLTDSGHDFFTQTGLKSSLTITGLKSGYVSEGFRNSIPGTSSAKINVRLAPEENPTAIFNSLKSFIIKNSPDYADIELTLAESAPGVKLDNNNEFMSQAKKLLSKVHNQEVVNIYVGGTLPIVKDIQSILKIPILMIPLANHDCGMHSAEENFSLDLIKKGLAFSALFFSKQ